MSEVPQSFSQAGHLAHLNLRSQYAPYKHLIASVITDKNPRITTVVNKLEDVGTESEFRTFPMEVLAGPPDTEVEVSESGCTFQFDFAKVYWNTRLGEEHERLFSKFKPGEAVADVMAGVGPFAIPAGKKRVFVWANDLNPESYKSLKNNIKLNKVRLLTSSFSPLTHIFRLGTSSPPPVLMAVLSSAPPSAPSTRCLQTPLPPHSPSSLPRRAPAPPRSRSRHRNQRSYRSHRRSHTS